MPLLETFANATKRGWLRSGSAPTNAGAYEQIATSFGTGSSGVITFSSIPSTYKHLQIRYTARVSDTSNQIYVRANGQTGTTQYIAHALQGTGTAVAASFSSSTGYIVIEQGPAGSSHTTDAFGVGIIDIYNYADGITNTTLRTLAGLESAASSKRIGLQSGAFLFTNIISSITLSAPTGNWTTTSRFSLYGIKG